MYECNFCNDVQHFLPHGIWINLFHRLAIRNARLSTNWPSSSLMTPNIQQMAPPVTPSFWIPRTSCRKGFGGSTGCSDQPVHPQNCTASPFKTVRVGSQAASLALCILVACLSLLMGQKHFPVNREHLSAIFDLAGARQNTWKNIWTHCRSQKFLPSPPRPVTPESLFSSLS